ncbi:MAG: hypothetical protein IPG88_08750 [Gemmatimonadetes bacterium]|nr:hypothetical protein [Gemmatimonadota bacterium]
MKGDEAFEDLLAWHGPRPAVGLGDERVEFVVQVAEDAAGGEFVDGALLWGERVARAQLLDDVVHPGHGDPLITGERVLAVRVEALGEGCDADAEVVRWGGEGKASEQVPFVYR